MKPVIFLRIASLLTLIHSILHTVGGVFGKPLPGAASTVYSAMQSNVFLAFGQQRTYAAFYRGMGLGITIFLTAEAIAFWLLASLAKTDGARLRPLLAVFCAAYLVFAVDSYVYFFTGPVVVEILIAACLACAIVTAKRGNGALSARPA
ncbi:MAG: hypothetical protein WCC26_13140 [Terracidiphilus sp.]